VAVVISLDRNHRNSGIAEHGEAVNRMIHCFRLDAAGIEEIAGNEHKGDLLSESIFLKACAPGFEEVLGARFRPVASNSEMNVCYMKEFRHRLQCNIRWAD
jgi:hypothetical protein